MKLISRVKLSKQRYWNCKGSKLLCPNPPDPEISPCSKVNNQHLSWTKPGQSPADTSVSLFLITAPFTCCVSIIFLATQRRIPLPEQLNHCFFFVEILTPEYPILSLTLTKQLKLSTKLNLILQIWKSRKELFFWTLIWVVLEMTDSFCCLGIRVSRSQHAAWMEE